MKFFIYCFIIILSVSASINFGQVLDFNKSNQLRQEAIKKYNEKDFNGFLQNAKAASDLRKNHPGLFYNVAIGYALINKQDSALLYLNRIADMKLFFPAEHDSDFVSLWNSNEFKKIVEKFNSAKNHYGQSEFAFELPEKDLLTESVAYNPLTETFYISSVHKSKILSYNKTESVKLFCESGEATFGGAFGMKVDSKNNLLWACTGFLPQVEGYTENHKGINEAVKYDLTTGKVLNKYKISEGDHLFGDLVLNSNGDVYIADSRDNNIYLIKNGSDKIEPFLISDTFASLQGIDFSSDEKYLFAADYSMGVYKIDMNTKNITALKISNDLTDLGIDGLYFYKNSLIGIQNGVTPQRVIKMNLGKNYDSITSWELIEANNEYFFEPTLGVLNGDDFYYIANSQWPNFQRDGTVDVEKLQNPVILKVKLQ